MMETMATYFVVDEVFETLFQAVKKGLITRLWRAINYSGLAIRSMEDNLTVYQPASGWVYLKPGIRNPKKKKKKKNENSWT